MYFRNPKYDILNYNIYISVFSMKSQHVKTPYIFEI
jgi:hypothetical protein